MNNKPATLEPIMRYSVQAEVVQRGLSRAVSREASIEFDTSAEQSDSRWAQPNCLPLPLQLASSRTSSVSRACCRLAMRPPPSG